MSLSLPLSYPYFFFKTTFYTSSILIVMTFFLQENVCGKCGAHTEQGTEHVCCKTEEISSDSDVSVKMENVSDDDDESDYTEIDSSVSDVEEEQLKELKKKKPEIGQF